MKHWLLGLIFSCLIVSGAHAQNQGRVVSSCGSPGITYTVGNYGPITLDQNGNLCFNGSGSGSLTANQGTANTLSNAWPFKITDGTNGPAAVKPASTAPVSTDPSLVVAINPNSINANGSALSANSAPVVVASDQSYADPCASPGIKKSSVPIAITSATTTALVAVSGSTTVYVCGFAVTIPNTATTATSIKFEYGTGTACASGANALTGAFGSNDAAAVSANPVQVTYGGGNSTIFATPASNGLCAVTTGNGTLAINGVVTFAQQ